MTKETLDPVQAAIILVHLDKMKVPEWMIKVIAGIFQKNYPEEWEPLNTAPTDGTEVIFWVSSEKGFPDQTANFFFMPDTELNRKVYGDKVGCWYWSESEEPLKRPDLVKGWKIYPQPPEGE